MKRTMFLAAIAATPIAAALPPIPADAAEETVEVAELWMRAPDGFWYSARYFSVSVRLVARADQTFDFVPWEPPA